MDIIFSKSDEPLLDLELSGIHGDTFKQSFLLDTGYNGSLLMYLSNTELLLKLRIDKHIQNSSKIQLGDGTEIQCFTTSTIMFYKNQEYEIELTLLEGKNTNDIPIVGIEFLRFFKAKICFDFLLEKYDTKFQL